MQVSNDSLPSKPPTEEELRVLAKDAKLTEHAIRAMNERARTSDDWLVCLVIFYRILNRHPLAIEALAAEHERVSKSARLSYELMSQCFIHEEFEVSAKLALDFNEKWPTTNAFADFLVRLYTHCIDFDIPLSEEDNLDLSRLRPGLKGLVFRSKQESEPAIRCLFDALLSDELEPAVSVLAFKLGLASNGIAEFAEYAYARRDSLQNQELVVLLALLNRAKERKMGLSLLQHIKAGALDFINLTVCISCLQGCHDYDTMRPFLFMYTSQNEASRFGLETCYAHAQSNHDSYLMKSIESHVFFSKNWRN